MFLWRRFVGPRVHEYQVGVLLALLFTEAFCFALVFYLRANVLVRLLSFRGSSFLALVYDKAFIGTPFCRGVFCWHSISGMHFIGTFCSSFFFGTFFRCFVKAFSWFSFFLWSRLWALMFLCGLFYFTLSFCGSHQLAY